MAVPFDLRADDWLYPSFVRGLRKFDSTVQIVFVGQSNRGQAVAFCKINDRFGRKGRIKKGIVAVDVQRQVMSDA